MHRRVLKSFAPFVGAAALIAVPIAFAAPASAAVIAPDETIPFDSELLESAVWEDILGEEEDIDAWCESFSEIPTPVDIPEIDEAFDLGPDEDPADFGYYLVVLSAYDDPQSEEDPAGLELYWDPSIGDELEHAAGENGEVILCIAELEDEPAPLPIVSVTPTVTGPVIETDRVADSTPVAGLGLAAAGTALVVGAGALVVSRRRQGSHR